MDNKAKRRTFGQEPVIRICLQLGIPPPKMTNTITNTNAPKTQPKTYLDTEPFSPSPTCDSLSSDPPPESQPGRRSPTLTTTTTITTTTTTRGELHYIYIQLPSNRKKTCPICVSVSLRNIPESTVNLLQSAVHPLTHLHSDTSSVRVLGHGWWRVHWRQRGCATARCICRLFFPKTRADLTRFGVGRCRPGLVPACLPFLVNANGCC